VKKLIRLIAIDLDGTLLNSSSRISKNNREAIRRSLDGGIKVVLSTGKSIAFVKEIIKDLNLLDPQIVYGGTTIIDKNSKILTALKIPKRSYIEIIKMVRQWGKGFAIGTADGVLYYEKDHQYLKNIVKTGDPLVKVKDLTVDKIADNALLLTITVDKDDQFNNFVKLNIGNDIKTRRGGPYYLNVLNKKAGKVFGIKKILELTGIKRNEVMAIGDSENDLGIIKFAATGVAMSNSPTIIKKSADFIVSDNDNDGVAEAIYKYIKL